MFTSNILQLMDDSHLLNPSQYYVVDYPLRHHNHHQQFQPWEHMVKMFGFSPNEIGVKQELGEDGQVTVAIHAKSENEDDYQEVRKKVKVPINVDTNKLKSFVLKDGVLLRAPFKIEKKQRNALELCRQDDWNGIWGEMERMNNRMHDLIGRDNVMELPRTEYCENEEGKTMWTVTINVGNDLKSEDMSLKLKDNNIYLNSKKEVKSDKGISTRNLHEMVSIPNGVEQDKLKSQFINGKLIISAPATKLCIKKDGETIPIEVGKSNDSGSAAGGDEKSMQIDNK